MTEFVVLSKNISIFKEYLLWFLFQLANWEKRLVWTNNKFVFFFNCSYREKLLEKISETDWWKSLMNSLICSSWNVPFKGFRFRYFFQPLQTKLVTATASPCLISANAADFWMNQFYLGSNLSYFGVILCPRIKFWKSEPI